MLLLLLMEIQIYVKHSHSHTERDARVFSVSVSVAHIHIDIGAFNLFLLRSLSRSILPLYMSISLTIAHSAIVLFQIYGQMARRGRRIILGKKSKRGQRNEEKNTNEFKHGISLFE